MLVHRHDQAFPEVCMIEAAKPRQPRVGRFWTRSARLYPVDFKRTAPEMPAAACFKREQHVNSPIPIKPGKDWRVKYRAGKFFRLSKGFTNLVYRILLLMVYFGYYSRRESRSRAPFLLYFHGS
jgi:hypothetical protein